MNIEEVTAERAKLERDIKNLLDSFESKTGMVVNGIAVERISVLSAKGSMVVDISVQADLPRGLA
ncbi:MAG: hypothetical protein ACLGQW_03040 [Acidobacteriota bacterium]